MINKLFGKYASIASGAIILIVALVQTFKPDLLDNQTVITLMSILGIHAGASVAGKK